MCKKLYTFWKNHGHFSKPPERVFWLWSGVLANFVIRRRRRRRRIFTPPHLAATSFCFSFCVLALHFFVSNRLMICIVERVENEIIINIVALCRSNFFSFFVLESGYVNWKNLVWLSFWTTTRQVLLMLALFSPKRFCFYLLISTKKPNSFVAVICLKVFSKRRRSIQTMLRAILCKTFPWPQSIIWENFSKFLILWRVAWKVLSKKKTNSTEENVFKSFDGLYLILLFNKQHLQTFNIVFFLLLWTNTCKLKLLCENHSFTKVFTGNDSLSCEHVLLYICYCCHPPSFMFLFQRKWSFILSKSVHWKLHAKMGWTFVKVHKTKVESSGTQT